LQGIIPTIIDMGLNHQDINIWGDGTVIRDYIHVSDVVNAFLKAGAYHGSKRIFNVSSGRGHSVNEIIHMLEGFLNQPLQIIHTQGLASDVQANILDNSRARRYLNWIPKKNLEEGISQLTQYMVEHQNI